jgi:hypothetical protein
VPKKSFTYGKKKEWQGAEGSWPGINNTNLVQNVGLLGIWN